MPKMEVAGDRTPQELAPSQHALPARLPASLLPPYLGPEETLCSCASNVIDNCAPCAAPRHLIPEASLLSHFYASRWAGHLIEAMDEQDDTALHLH